MAKKPQPRQKSRRKEVDSSLSENRQDTRDRTIRYWPALIAGVVLLVAGAFLAQRLSAQTLNEELFNKLPADSYLAGSGSLRTLDPETLKQLSANANIYPAQSAELLNILQQSGAQPKVARKAVDDQFAFSVTTGGSLFIFTIKGESAYAELAQSFASQLESKQTFSDAGTEYLSGTLKGTTRPVTVGRNGAYIYLAGSPDLIKKSAVENAGFSNVPGFTETAARLPVSDAYLFYNTVPVRAKIGFEAPLFGLALNDAGDSIDIQFASSEIQTVSSELPVTTGKLLPSTETAAGSVSGNNAGRYLQLLQEQRSEEDLPKVLALQNSIASLNRTLGKDLQRDFLAEATGPFVYSRYPGTDGNEWAGFAEFSSAEAARSRLDEFRKLLQEKLTVPVRRQIVRVLPDGSQSTEIVAEGRAPLTFTDVSVEGKNGQTVAIPGLGPVSFVLSDQYLVAASTPDGVSRMLKSIGKPGEPVAGGGQLAIRLKLAEAYKLPGDSDSLSDWILATRPAAGALTLSKTTGELSGSVTFQRQR